MDARGVLMNFNIFVKNVIKDIFLKMENVFVVKEKDLILMVNAKFVILRVVKYVILTVKIIAIDVLIIYQLKLLMENVNVLVNFNILINQDIV